MTITATCYLKLDIEVELLIAIAKKAIERCLRWIHPLAKWILL